MDNYSLEAYQRAEKIPDEIRDEILSWSDYFIKNTIGKQLVRAADSICAIIAEGYGRFHFKDNKNFCCYSRGSWIETKGWIRKSKIRKLIPSDIADQYLEKLNQLHKMLNAYIGSPGRKAPETPNSTSLLITDGKSANDPSANPLK